jgi:dTMP kinase
MANERNLFLFAYLFEHFHTMFFSLDGIDGVGKSTQLQLFVQWLRDCSGESVIVCRDPGSTSLGESIRQLLLDREGARIDIHAEMLLYMAARAQLVSEIIQPALQRNQHVVCDRYLLANLAYQAFGGNLPLDQVQAVGRIATQQLLPDVTFLLDIDPDLAASRMQQRSPNQSGDRMESRGTDFQRRVRAGFLQIAADDDRIHVLDASASIEQIQTEIRQIAQRQIAHQDTKRTVK